MALGQAIGLAAVVLLVLLAGHALPRPEALAWAVAAGLAGTGGLAAFYRLLASGPMSLGAPLVAVVGAGVPAAFGLATGDHLSAAQVGGMLLGLVAVVVVSLSPEPTRDELGADGLSVAPAGARVTALAALPFILLAGLGFAGFYVFIGHATRLADGALWWLVLAARGATVAVAGAALLSTGGLRAVRGRLRSVAPALLVAGLGDAGGNGFFLLSMGEGAFSTAVVLTSLYPVMTIALAALVLRERLHRWHLVGVALALAGVVLIAL